MYYNTISKELLNVLKALMNADEFSDFRLVGGTSLSLQLGHRKLVDIDILVMSLMVKLILKRLINL